MYPLFFFIYVMVFIIAALIICLVENSVLLKCRKLRREDQETSDWIVSRISLFYDMSLVSVVIEISS